MNPFQIAEAAQVVAQAVAQGEPVQTHNVGWSKTAIGVWLGLLMAVVYGLPKFITAMRKLAYDRGDQLDDERRADLDRMRQDIAEVKQEAKSARERAASAEDRAREAENRLSAAVVVIRVLSARIRTEWPDDPMLKDIGELIDAATAPDATVLKGFKRIAGIAGHVESD